MRCDHFQALEVACFSIYSYHGQVQNFANYSVHILWCSVLPVEILSAHKSTAHRDNMMNGFISLFTYTICWVSTIERFCILFISKTMKGSSFSAGFHKFSVFCAFSKYS